MRNLYLFFRRFHVTFLFLFLELVSLILFFRYNHYPNAAFYRLTSSLTGQVNELYTRIDQYFSLRQTNLILSEENARLHARMPESVYLSDTRLFLRQDTLLCQAYQFINARVISQTVNRQRNYLMLGKGSLQGIKPHMGVIVGNRLVGQVVSVSSHFSWVMSMLHPGSHISAMFLKNHQLVTVEWTGGDYLTGLVTEIPKHLSISTGDTIVTSGNSEIYPEGILIGVIQNLKEQKNRNFNQATLDFLTDFNGLSYVQVVVDLFKAEKDSLRNTYP